MNIMRPIAHRRNTFQEQARQRSKYLPNSTKFIEKKNLKNTSEHWFKGAITNSF